MCAQCKGMPPSMRHFNSESLPVGIIELGHVLKVGRVLSHQGALAEEMKLVGEAVSLSKGLDVGEKIRLGNAGERILDLARVVGHHGRKALLAHRLRLTTPGFITVIPVHGGLASSVSARAHHVGVVWVVVTHRNLVPSTLR